MRMTVVAAALALLLSPAAHAIVNMEGLHTGSVPEGYSGEVEASASGSSGNTDRTDYALGGRLQYHQGIHTVFLLASRAYGEVSGVKNTDRSFGHLRYIRQSWPNVALEGFLQGEHDSFARLDYRALIGAGLRYSPYRHEGVGQVYLGLGGMRELERIDDAYPDGGTTEHWRANTYLVLQYQLTPQVSLHNSTYYQPKFGDSGDYRLLEQGAMAVGLTNSLSLVLSVDYRYTSRPPTDVKSGDFSYRTSLSYSLR